MRNIPCFIPLPENQFLITGRFNDDYSQVNDAIYTNHEGLDFGTPIGTPLTIAMSCIVESTVINSFGYGNYLVLRDIQNQEMFYLAAHLSEILVKKGQTVNLGDIVAKTGNSRGIDGNGNPMFIAPHLHQGAYLVESKDKWNDQGTGLYWGVNWYFNQNLTVDPFDNSIHWIGKQKS